MTDPIDLHEVPEDERLDHDEPGNLLSGSDATEDGDDSHLFADSRDNPGELIEEDLG